MSGSSRVFIPRKSMLTLRSIQSCRESAMREHSQDVLTRGNARLHGGCVLCALSETHKQDLLPWSSAFALRHAPEIKPNEFDFGVHFQVGLHSVELLATAIRHRGVLPSMADCEKLVGIAAAVSLPLVQLVFGQLLLRAKCCEHWQCFSRTQNGISLHKEESVERRSLLVVFFFRRLLGWRLEAGGDPGMPSSRVFSRAFSLRGSQIPYPLVPTYFQFRKTGL